MPKTFRDAVEVTRQISVRYLWIDGLCIIQGDAEDWMHESKRMGSIYQGACLVIAASGAKSPNDGCFMSTPREIEPIDLPLYTSIGQDNASFNICALSWEPYMPRLGALETRGWALQESHLARRRLNFMPGGPSWVCNTTLGTTERMIEMNLDGYTGWESLVCRFSYTKLTHHSDRLMAVEGIATELQKKTKDTYNSGVFLSRIAFQLLWMGEDVAPELEDLPGVPSWSWASRGGRKAFPSELAGLQADIDQSKVQIDDKGCLMLQGGLIECKAQTLASGTIEDLGDTRNALIFTAFTLYSEYPEHAVFLEAVDSQCLGFGMFDRQRFDTVHCFCLMSAKLEQFAMWRPRYGQYLPRSCHEIESTFADVLRQQGFGAWCFYEGTRITEHR